MTWRTTIRDVNRASLMAYRSELRRELKNLTRDEYLDLDSVERFLRNDSYEHTRRQAVEHAMQDGVVIVNVDATRGDVIVPDDVRRAHTRLQFCLGDPDDLWIDDEGIRGSLTFGGVDVPCFIPWDAVWGFTGKRGGELWWDNMPPDVFAEYEAARADMVRRTSEKPIAPPKVFDEHPVIGPEVRRLIDVVARYRNQERERALELLDEDERVEAEEAAVRRTTVKPGDVIRFTRKALRSMYGTDQWGCGGKAPDQRWTVVSCDCGLCALGNHVAVDEPSFYADEPEYAALPRHMARANVERCPFARTKPSAEESSTWRADAWEQLGVDVARGMVRRPAT